MDSLDTCLDVAFPSSCRPSNHYKCFSEDVVMFVSCFATSQVGRSVIFYLGSWTAPQYSVEIGFWIVSTMSGGMSLVTAYVFFGWCRNILHPVWLQFYNSTRSWTRYLWSHFFVALVVVHVMAADSLAQPRRWTDAEKQLDLTATVALLHETVNLTNLIFQGPTAPDEESWVTQATAQLRRTICALKQLFRTRCDNVDLTYSEASLR